MKNVILMMTEIAAVDALLIGIFIISVLVVILLVFLNQKSKPKYLKKITNVVLVLTMLLLPFFSLLNVKAEGTITEITTDDNKKVTNTTDIIVSNIMGNENELDVIKY